MKNVYMPRYNGEIFQTSQGALLLFMGDAERWIGLWPGMSWDTFYDQYYPLYTPLPSNYKKIPVIWIGPHVDYCRPPIIGGQSGEYGHLVRHKRFEEANKLMIKPRCDKVSNFRHCSFECWYLLERQTIDSQERLIRFEAVFKQFKNRWAIYRQRWLNGS